MKLARLAASLTVTALACAALVAGTGTGEAAVDGAPVLNGPQLGLATSGSTVGITGSAPAGLTVGIWFHKRGTPGYTMRRSLIVGSDGTFSTSYLANDDYRYYAEGDNQKSGTNLTQVPVQIDGPRTRSATRDEGYHLTGLSIPHTIVKFHLHAKGTPVDDFMTRTANVQANGSWAFGYPSHTDYQVFAISSANNTFTPSYLLLVN
jgi:hypothetical protein